MKYWRAFRNYAVAQYRRLVKRMKAERVQRKHLPRFDIFMTLERTQDRWADLSPAWSLKLAPVALEFRKKFGSVGEAAAFVSRDVTRLAEKVGEYPTVQIEGTEVHLTLGIPSPQILTEGDFDFAVAIDGVEPPAADAGSGTVQKKAA